MEGGVCPEECLQPFYSVLHMDPGLKVSVSDIMR